MYSQQLTVVEVVEGKTGMKCHFRPSAFVAGTCEHPELAF